MSHVREDVLVSLCIADRPKNPEELAKMIAQISNAFRFYEVLIVTADPADHVSDAALLAMNENLRLIRVRPGTSFYRRRTVSAAEAIGDVVFLGTVEELDRIDPVAFLMDAADNQTIVQAARSRHVGADSLLRLLGRSSGFRIGEGEMLGAAYPRTLLNVLLHRSDRELALRFTPRDSGIPVCTVSQGGPAVRSDSGLGARLVLVQKLLTNAAPRVLGVVSVLSVFVSCIGILYAFYALAAWAILDQVQPGWLTTSLVLSLTAVFLGAAIFGLATGLMKLLDIAGGDVIDDVIEEQGRTDLFLRVANDLNVELAATPGAHMTEEGL